MIYNSLSHIIIENTLIENQRLLLYQTLQSNTKKFGCESVTAGSIDLRGIKSCFGTLSFNRDILLALYSFWIFLGDVQPQGAVLELSLDILHRNGRTYVETAGAGAAVPFLADILPASSFSSLSRDLAAVIVM